MVNKIQSYLDKILSAKTSIKKELIQMNVTDVTNKFSTYPDKIDQVNSMPRVTIGSETLPIAELDSNSRVIRNAEELIVADNITEVEGYNRNLVSGTIEMSGTYITSTYGYPADGIRDAITGSNSSIYIICQGHDTTAYENIRYTLTSSPTGTSIEYQTAYNNTATDPGGLYVCKIIGLTKSVSVSIAVNSRNSSYDYYEYDITLTEV